MAPDYLDAAVLNSGISIGRPSKVTHRTHWCQSAPLIRDEIWSCLSLLKAKGQSVLVIDKNVENLTLIADRHYIIERGRAVWSGTSAELIAEPELQHR